MTYFSKNTQHPLIKNEKQYQVHEHLIAIQSEDRDVLKWPNSSHFEFELPIEYKNVSAIRIIDIQIPNTFYTFSNRRQNTKLLIHYAATTYTINIEEGTYTPEQLCNELTIKIATIIPTIDITVKHNPINKKIYFFTDNVIYLDFTIDPYCNIDTLDIDNCNTCSIPSSHLARSNRPNSINCYPGNCIGTDAYVINHGPTAFDKKSEWGLGNYIGFQKELYESTTLISGNYAWCENGVLTGILHGGGTPTHVIEGALSINICDYDNIYMELDKYNCIDELEPYCFNTNAANQVKFANYKGKKIPICCNEQQPNKTYNGKHNAAIAIIPVGGGITYQTGDSMISGTFNSIPPIPRIKKFKVKFRWHDGDLVNFNNCNVNFVIQVMELINEMNQIPNITNINSLVY